MKPLIIYILSLFFLTGTGFLSQAQLKSKVTGNWSGELVLPGQKLEIIFKIAMVSKAEYSATMDVPKQGAKDIPVSAVTLNSDSLQLKVDMIRGSFSGVFQNDSTIEGKWKQNGAEFPLLLSKTDKVTELLRPQTPKKPFPYIIENVEYVNKKSGFKLAGTLTLPPTTKDCPAVILISGSGAQDRDESIFEHKPFWVIADYLTRKGIAVLRVDDRGVGGSEGNNDDATSKDFADDVQAGVDFLRNRKDISKSQIGLIGYGEGGIIAPIVANNSKDVSFVVLLAGPGVDGEQILYEQGELLNKAAGLTEEQTQQNKKLQEAIFNILLTEKDSAKQVDRLQKTYTNGMYFTLNDDQKNAVNAAINGINSPWFKYFLTYNPYPALTKIKCQVLALIGEKDLQVPAKTNLAAIEKALTEGGNANFKTMELQGINHLFQKCETGSVAEYAQIEETIYPEVMKIMKDWILELNSK